MVRTADWWHTHPLPRPPSDSVLTSSSSSIADLLAGARSRRSSNTLNTARPSFGSVTRIDSIETNGVGIVVKLKDDIRHYIVPIGSTPIRLNKNIERKRVKSTKRKEEQETAHSLASRTVAFESVVVVVGPGLDDVAFFARDHVHSLKQ